MGKLVFDVLTESLKQHKVTILNRARRRVPYLDDVAQKNLEREYEILKAYGGGYYEKEILVDENQCLFDYELMKAVRNIHIVHAYGFRDGISSQTKSVDYTEV